MTTTTKISLRERIQRYFERHPDEWIASGDIQRLVQEKTTYTPSNSSRRLRELANDGVLLVKYVKGHAWYMLNPGRDLL